MTGRKSLCSKHWPLCAQEDEVSGTTAALQASGFRKHWARVHVRAFSESSSSAACGFPRHYSGRCQGISWILQTFASPSACPPSSVHRSTFSLLAPTAKTPESGELGIGVRIRANREGGDASWARALLPEAEVPSAMGAVIALRFGFQDAPLKFCRLRSFSSRGKGFSIPSTIHCNTVARRRRLVTKD